MRLSQVLMCAFLCVVACGCVRSIQPVLKDSQLIANDSLAGHWQPSDDKGLIEIQKPGEDKTYKVTYTDKDGQKGEFLIRLGKVQDLTIAEIRPADPAPNASAVYKAHLLPVHSFMVIHQTDPEIRFSMMKAEWLEQYVKDHPGELQIASAGEGKGNIVVTSSTDDLQSFILRHRNDADAYGEESRLVRATATTAPAK